MGKKLVLIDGNSIMNRAFYGVPDLTNSEGIHTNAIYGFLNIMFKVLDEETPDYLMVAFDLKHPTFRHEMFTEYKGTRKPMPEDLSEQMPVIKEVLKAMDITIMEQAGYEADDILGTMAKRAERDGCQVSLVSGDRDLLQLASDTIKIRIPKTKFGKTQVEDYNTNDVIEKYGVTPLQIIDLKGLMGDASDNIPGVPGIGEKTATKIISEFGSVEEAIKNVEKIMPNKARENLKSHTDMAILSKELATIKLDCQLDHSVEDGGIQNIYSEDALKWIQKLEFKSMLTKFDTKLSTDTNLEQSFAVIDTKREAESAFQQILKVKTKSVGCVMVVDPTNCETDYQTNGDGQFSLFETDAEIVNQPLIGASISFCDEDEIKTYYFELGDKLTPNTIMEGIEKCNRNEICVSFMDLKSQLKVIEFKNTKKVFDVSVAAYVLNPTKDSYDVEDIASEFLNMTVPSYAQLFAKSDIKTAYQEKKDGFIKYFSYLSYVSLKAYPVLVEKLKENDEWTLYETIELPLIFTLYDMETRGIKVNKQELKEYGEKLGTRIVTLEADIYALAGETFNINSPKQLGVILFEKMKLPFAKKTKTGYSTSADVLEKLKTEDPIIPMILEYRQLTKLKSTYADGLANYIGTKDQRIHSTFKQTITATGRISSTEPNLQNIPIRMELGRAIRKVFIPEDGFVFLDADYSQIELRVLAHMSGDKRLIQAYKESDDIHRITASQVFHTPLEEVTKQQRSNAKAVNFGIIYGISSFGLGQDLNITRKEAEGYINKYFETYGQVKAFVDSLVDEGKEKGFVTSLFGRRRPIPELSSSNFMQRSFGERIAMNSPIQGTAADIIKIAMIRVNETLKNQKMKSRLLLQIHDELLVETHESEIEQVKKILEEEMVNAADLLVPLEVEVEQGNNWYEAK